LRPSYEEYAERILIALYEAHQDPQYPGVRAHGSPGVLLATKAGIVSADGWQARDYRTSRKRWDIVAALRELIDKGYIKRTEGDTEDHTHPDMWNFRLTPQGKGYARELLGKRGEVDVAPIEEVGLPRPIRIFVSSTWEDLQPEREAVEQALHRMRDTAFSGMEYFGSRPETPREVSLAEVDLSDVYVGIFACRYGFGITEAEYHQARKRDIPCLIYLKDESVPVPPAHIEREPAKIAKLEALKCELKAHHTVSTFKGPDHLATQVVTDLHNLLGSAPTVRREEPPQRGPKYQITITDDDVDQLRVKADRLEKLVVELLQNVPVDSREDLLWQRSRWRRLDPDYHPTPQMKYSWRRPLPKNLSAKQRDARRLCRSWYYQARTLVASSLPHEMSSFEDSFARIMKFIELEIGAPADTRARNQLLASFKDRFDHPRSILDALVSVSTLKDQALDVTGEPDTAPLQPDMLRLQHLADNIRQDLALLKDYEDALRYEDDPRRRVKYQREIEQLRESAARYQQQYDELRAQVTGEPSAAMQNIAAQLQQMDAKLDALLTVQAVIRDDLSDLHQTVLARFDTSEQEIIAAVVKRLDQSQLATVQTVLDTIEAGRVLESQLQETLTALQETLAEIQYQGAAFPDQALVDGATRLLEVADAPKLDAKHKLKVTLPIVPTILSYEGEVELKSGLNLEAAWQRLMAKVRGER
jgi:hypothetical protein